MGDYLRKRRQLNLGRAVPFRKLLRVVMLISALNRCHPYPTSVSDSRTGRSNGPVDRIRSSEWRTRHLIWPIWLTHGPRLSSLHLHPKTLSGSAIAVQSFAVRVGRHAAKRANTIEARQTLLNREMSILLHETLN